MEHTIADKTFTRAEVSTHTDIEKDCWVVINNNVYDVTSFISSHPGGPKPFKHWGGKDCTLAFHDLTHPKKAYEKLQELLIGTVVEAEKLNIVHQRRESGNTSFTLKQISKHNHEFSCWIVLNGKIYDVTNFKHHPGKFETLVAVSGRDATKEMLKVNHKEETVKKMENFCFGTVKSECDICVFVQSFVCSPAFPITIIGAGIAYLIFKKLKK